MSLRFAVRGVCGVFLGVLASACSSDNSTTTGEPTCLAEAQSTDCTALYAPTFDAVFANTLSGTCAARECHRAPNPTGNMALDEIETAYTNLLAKSSTGEPRITPGDVKCGKVIVRLETPGESYSMPPGRQLPATELCSIRQWIANGAKRHE
jgi:hypothetical protein